MFKRILMAIDDSGPAARAVEVAVKIARQVGGELAAVHVVDSSLALTPEMTIVNERTMAQLRQRGVEILNAACAQVPVGMPIERFHVAGEPADCILATAQEWGADLIVIGSDSRGRLAHFLLGSTADSVIRKASCPVMTVRASAAVGAELYGEHHAT